MHKVIIILLTTISLSNVFAQNWTNNQLIAANTAANASGLTNEEKNVFLYLNLARLYPSDFARIELKAHLGDKYSNSSALNWYENGLKSLLLSMSPIHAITYSSNMYQLAKCFSDETARSGIIGHDRVNCPKGYYGECCSYGSSTGKEIILQLLIDDGVSSLGHRKICLSLEYFSMGPSINTHKQYSNCCVLDFTFANGIDYSSSTAPIISANSSNSNKPSNSNSTFGSNSNNSNNSNTTNSTYNSQLELTELKNKVAQLNSIVSEKDGTITKLNSKISTLNNEKYQLEVNQTNLNNSLNSLQQQQSQKDAQYNKLNGEFKLLSDRRTSARKSKYNADAFHALTFKIGLNTFYPSINPTSLGKFNMNILSFGVETMFGVNFGDSYRRNSLGITLRANQTNRFLTKVMDSSATQPLQFYDAELTTLIREWLSIGIGANLSTSYGSPTYQINPSVSLGLCLGPKNWKIQINQQATMNADKKISGRASLGLAMRF